MTGPTHREYSVTFVCIAAMIMYSCSMFTLKFNINQPNYYLALLMMLPISKLGAKFPDVDHEWEYVKDKTVVNRILNTLIHITGGQHRSWQTHSIDIVLILTLAAIILPDKLIEYGVVSAVNGKLIYLIVIAFMSGWVSHIFSDMLNGVGVRLICVKRWRVAFVPRKFLWFRFKTGEHWEQFNYFVIRKINIVLGILAVAYPYIEHGVKHVAERVIFM